jgi:branched-chain amino acid transport system permease protein
MTRGREMLATLALSGAFLGFVEGDAYRQDLGMLAIAYGLLALGMYLPLALCGSLSLAYNAYFAIGAYAVAIVAQRAPALLPLAAPLAILISMATAALLGLVTRKLSGFHLAVATMMFGIAVHTWLLNADGVTGGATGIGDIPRPTILGWTLDRGALIGLGVTLIWLIATAIARLRVSLIGIAMRAQRESVVAAAASGVPTAAVRILALAVGAGIATLAGVLLAFMNRFVLPDSFAIKVVFLVLFMPVLGGLSTPWGAVLGALVVVAFTLGFDFFQGPGSLTFGLLTLAVLLLAPAGLLGGLAGLAGRLRRGRAAPQVRERSA